LLEVGNGHARIAEVEAAGEGEGGRRDEKESGENRDDGAGALGAARRGFARHAVPLTWRCG